MTKDEKKLSTMKDELEISVNGMAKSVDNDVADKKLRPLNFLESSGSANIAYNNIRDELIKKAKIKEIKADKQALDDFAAYLYEERVRGDSIPREMWFNPNFAIGYLSAETRRFLDKFCHLVNLNPNKYEFEACDELDKEIYVSIRRKPIEFGRYLKFTLKKSKPEYYVIHTDTRRVDYIENSENLPPNFRVLIKSLDSIQLGNKK